MGDVSRKPACEGFCPSGMVLIAFIICTFFIGCGKSKNIIENEIYAKSITEKFLDALIIQNNTEILSCIIETEEQYSKYISISSLINSILEEKAKEISLGIILPFVLEYEIMDCILKENSAVIKVNFANLSEQNIYLEKIEGAWFVNYGKFNANFNTNILKNSVKLIFKIMLFI
jgi:hypothetical protein